MKNQLVYGFAAHHGTKYMLSRFPPQQRVNYAIGFFVALSAIFVALELRDQEPNFYQQLGLPANCTGGQINKRFKELARRFHPDSKFSHTEEDEEQFIKLTKMKEMLVDPEKRAVYNQLGPKSFAKNMDDPGLYLMMASSYLVQSVFIFIYTMGGRDSGQSRSYAFGGMMFLALLDFMMKFGNLDFGNAIVPSWTVHDKIEFMKELYTVYLHAAIIYVSVTYFDREEAALTMMRFVMEEQRKILAILEAEPWKEQKKMSAAEMTESVKENKNQRVAQSVLGRRVEKIAETQRKKEGGGTNWGLIIFVVVTLMQSGWFG